MFLVPIVGAPVGNRSRLMHLVLLTLLVLLVVHGRALAVVTCLLQVILLTKATFGRR